MITLIQYPEQNKWADLVRRPAADNDAVKKTVKDILARVREEGDVALRDFSSRFDGYESPDFKVTAEEWEAAETIPDSLKNAIDIAYTNIKKFHEAQKTRDIKVDTMSGITCTYRYLPVVNVGLYIPGGTAPLFSTLLMLGIPARVAGCREITIVSPPGPGGRISPVILYVARLLNIHSIYKIGGAQAVAALAYGTVSIPRVDKIFGPGNAYVTAAKMAVQTEGVAIDLPAGPSELLVIADGSAEPAYVAADLLSQAEHGIDSQVMLLTTEKGIAKKVMEEIALQMEGLPRADFARESLSKSKIIVMSSMEACMEFSNTYAPEHLILACANNEYWADKVENAGSVFLGHWAPESAGDYASGTNHTLPTNGYARAYSGVSVHSFQKSVSFQKITREGLMQIGPSVINMARAEGLDAHANAISVRLEKILSYERRI